MWRFRRVNIQFFSVLLCMLLAFYTNISRTPCCDENKLVLLCQFISSRYWKIVYILLHSSYSGKGACWVRRHWIHRFFIHQGAFSSASPSPLPLSSRTQGFSVKKEAEQLFSARSKHQLASILKIQRKNSHDFTVDVHIGWENVKLLMDDIIFHDYLFLIPAFVPG